MKTVYKDIMVKEYQNEYGKARLKIGDAMPISDVNRNIVPDKCFMDLNTIEKLALITNNERLQPCPDWQNRGAKSYYMYHYECNIVGIVEILEIEFTATVNPIEEIARLVKISGANFWQTISDRKESIT